MKSSVTVEEGFKPVTVTLTLETKREADAFYGLLNSRKLENVLLENGLDLDPVYRQLKNLGLDGSNNNPVLQWVSR